MGVDAWGGFEAEDMVANAHQSEESTESGQPDRHEMPRPRLSSVYLMKLPKDGGSGGIPPRTGHEADLDNREIVLEPRFARQRTKVLNQRVHRRALGP